MPNACPPLHQRKQSLADKKLAWVRSVKKPRVVSDLDTDQDLSIRAQKLVTEPIDLPHKGQDI